MFGLTAQAQTVGGRTEVFPGSELEEYARYAQTLGQSPLYPWTLRPFSAGQLDRILRISGDHPWKNRYDFGPRRSDVSIDVVRPTFTLRYNTAFPYGSNDGPVWAGRGLTAAFQVGFAMRVGPISLTLAPEFFSAQNKAFPLLPNGDTTRLRFADGQFKNVIDRPQRFGDGAYTVLDPGQSTLRIDLFGLGAGISTANETWGPADNYAYILSTNAPGVPRAFFGTSQPLNLYLFRLHSLIEWGILSQSHYSPVGGSRYIQSTQQPGTRRFMSGIIASIQPRGMDGLEVGAARFYHIGWPRGGPQWSDFRRPLEAIFKNNLRPEPPLPGTNQVVAVRENQLASLFARWVVPGAGFEVYGEFGREDHSADTRDFLAEPDHGGASRMFGLRKMWRSGYALRAEGINFEAPPIKQVRSEGSVYLHSILRQGHTERGQVLGADVGVGSGAGSTVAVDRYSAKGRTTAFWSRTIGHEIGTYYLTGADVSAKSDVVHSLGVDALRFVGPVDLTMKGVLSANLNRNFQGDAYNLNVQLGARFSSW